MAQWFPEAEAHESKIAEFRLTLDGWAACWHSLMDLAAIKTFDQLQSAFLRFFHRRVPQREIIGQFYTMKQLSTEYVTDFSLRFQSLQRQHTQAPIDKEARETFLAALRWPLWTTLTTQAMKGETTNMVIEMGMMGCPWHHFGKRFPRTRNIDFARQFHAQSVMALAWQKKIEQERKERENNDYLLL